MKLPPYPHYPNLKGERISLRQIAQSDLQDIVEISFYDAIQATTVEITRTCGYYSGLENGEGELADDEVEYEFKKGTNNSFFL